MTEIGWLIEAKGTPTTCWLMYNATLTCNSVEALRFCRKSDAENFLEIFLNAKFGEDVISIYKRRLHKTCYFVSEHIWRDES